jgi:hypothetical protein
LPVSRIDQRLLFNVEHCSLTLSPLSYLAEGAVHNG